MGAGVEVDVFVEDEHQKVFPTSSGEFYKVSLSAVFYPLLSPQPIGISPVQLRQSSSTSIILNLSSLHATIVCFDSSHASFTLPHSIKSRSIPVHATQCSSIQPPPASRHLDSPNPPPEQNQHQTRLHNHPSITRHSLRTSSFWLPPPSPFDLPRIPPHRPRQSRQILPPLRDLPRHVRRAGAIPSSPLHPLLPLREGTGVPALPRRARLAAVSNRGGAVHCVQTVRGDLSGERDYD